MATASNLHATSSLARWDVFLSFHSRDAGTSFVSHLYSAFDQAGISTFLYDPALEEDEDIRIDAMIHSKMFVVVVSENFVTENFRCTLRSFNSLDDILSFVDIPSPYRIANRVIPAFYYVDPSGMRHLRGHFRVMEICQMFFSDHLVDQWKAGLAGIAELSGYHLKEDQNE